MPKLQSQWIWPKGWIVVLSFLSLFVGLLALSKEEAQYVYAEVEDFEDQKILRSAKKTWLRGASYHALEMVEEGLQRFPKNSSLHLLRGKIYVSMRKNNLAIQAYDTAIKGAPHSIDARWAKWALLTRMGKREFAVRELRQMESKDEKNPVLRLRLAHDLRKLDRLDEALLQYREAVSLAPQMTGWRLYVARALYDVLDYEAAQQEVDQVLGMARKGSRLEYAARSLHDVVYGKTTDKGRRSLPFPNAQKSAVAGKQWALMREKAWKHMNDGDFQRAESILERILQLRPTDHRAAYDLGKTLMELERYEEAIVSFTNGIRLSPDAAVYPDSVFRMGQCLSYLERWDQALSYFVELERIADWRQESTYAMNFPHESQVQGWLLKAKEHVSSSQSPVPIPTLRTDSPFALGLDADSGKKTVSTPFQMTKVSPRIALMGRDSDFSWFRYVIPAGEVMRDDMQAGTHEFLPFDAGDTFYDLRQDVFLVFGLALASYDEILLSAECYQEDGEFPSQAIPVTSDQVIAGSNEQSGYFLLSAPEGGWAPGVYRVDLFVGDTVAASSQVDEVRFRIWGKDVSP